jgi:hypothetical protein
MPGGGGSKAKALALLIRSEHLVSFPFTKKQPAAEPSTLRSRLRHWLTQSLLGTHLREGVLSLYLCRFFVMGQCIT